MSKKHPTLGKRTLAKMYFLTKKENIKGDNFEFNSPIPELRKEDENIKIKNVK
jgi:hypothetical protein